jgi:hypothetical protein
VIVVRHPAAVVSSLSKLGWEFDFSDLISQSNLLRDWLKPFKEEMKAMLDSSQDVIAQGSLLWKMIYRVAADLKDKQSEIILVRHEDLSLDPVNQFKQIYDQLGLRFSPESVRAIESSSSEENPKETSTRNVHSVAVDSPASIKNWQIRLSAEEIDRIYQLTGDVAPIYYSEADWQ